jgi:hypothetical protein
MIWERHVALMGRDEMRQSSDKKDGGKRTLARTGRSWGDNIIMDFRKMGC